MQLPQQAGRRGARKVLSLSLICMVFILRTTASCLYKMLLAVSDASRWFGYQLQTLKSDVADNTCKLLPSL